MEGFKNPIHGNRPLEGYPPSPRGLLGILMRFSQKVSVINLVTYFVINFVTKLVANLVNHQIGC